MIIIQDEKISPYVIHIDSSQFTVGIPKTDKTGKEVLTHTSYFTSLAYALKYISKQLLLSRNMQSVLTIEEFIDLYEEINEMLLENISI